VIGAAKAGAARRAAEGLIATVNVVAGGAGSVGDGRYGAGALVGVMSVPGEVACGSGHGDGIGLGCAYRAAACVGTDAAGSRRAY